MEKVGNHEMTWIDERPGQSQRGGCQTSNSINQSKAEREAGIKGPARKAKKEERRRGEANKKGEAHREETATKGRKEARKGRTREEDGRGLINCSSLSVCYVRFSKVAADGYSKTIAQERIWSHSDILGLVRN